MNSLTGSIILILLFVNLCNTLSPQCRNEKGEPVDWFYIYKLPKERDHPNSLVRNGVAYMYLTPSTLQKGWVLSNVSIGDPLSMVGTTLYPLYMEKNIISLLYNDQPPQIMSDFPESDFFSSKKRQGQQKPRSRKYYKYLRNRKRYYADTDLVEMRKMHYQYMKTKTESGHTKGVVLGDGFTSLWLVHSVPHFPPIPIDNSTTYSYPTTGTKFGQTFLCTSVPTSTLNQISLQLRYNEPLITYYHLPMVFENVLPNFVDLIHNKSITSSPWYHIESFVTLEGRRFLSFAKSSMFNDDLYSGLVAEVLQSDLLVESWMNGPGTLDSECSRRYQVKNIERIKFPIEKMSFTSHSDHSKWAVADAHRMHLSQDTKVAEYWVCVGDINRALSQELRGGGTVCTTGPMLWDNFAHLVESVQKC